MKKKAIKKWTEDLTIHSFKDIQMTNSHMKKMINVTNHQGNANQNHSELSPHICQNGKRQEIKVLETTEEKENLTLLVGV